METTAQNEIYFNFPISLMQGVYEKNKSRKDFLNEILYYHIYWHYLKLTNVYNEDDSLNYEETYLERFKRSAGYWKINLINPEKAFADAKHLHDYKSKNTVYTSISRTTFWQFYNDEKTDFEWNVLLSFLALKTILGKKKYCKTDNDMMFARMRGKKTKKEYYRTKGIKITRYYRDKIFNELQNNWNLIYYSHYTKGFYFGFAGDITLKELVFEAEKRRKSLKENIREKQKKEAIKDALLSLKSSAP